MIASLRGRLLGDPTADGIVIEVGGVGLLIAVTAAAERAATANRNDVSLHTHLVVREDALSLYGFVDTAERTLFQLFLSVSGLGPKTSLALLSAYPADRLTLAIASGDTALLSSVSGIGKRTAERVIVELRDKVAAVPASASAPGDAMNGDRLEARDALVALGYSLADADAALEATVGTTEERVVAALGKLRR